MCATDQLRVIQLRNPNVATFFTNRALCYLKLGQWDHSCQDCRRALEMDPLLIKGHFFIGQALIELGHFDDAMKHLQRGTRARQSTSCFPASNARRPLTLGSHSLRLANSFSDPSS